MRVILDLVEHTTSGNYSTWTNDETNRRCRHLVVRHCAVGKRISRPRVRMLAKVLKSEEFAYAPMGYRLIRVTFEITPPVGPAYATTLQDTMPWQGAPPRGGQTFRLRCDRGLRLDFVKNRIVNY
jgi:hypothetical protein